MASQLLLTSAASGREKALFLTFALHSQPLTFSHEEAGCSLSPFSGDPGTASICSSEPGASPELCLSPWGGVWFWPAGSTWGGKNFVLRDVSNGKLQLLFTFGALFPFDFCSLKQFLCLKIKVVQSSFRKAGKVLC